MIIWPLLSVILAHVLGIIASITDIKYNRITNSILLLFGTLGVCLTFIQYILKTNLLWEAYLFNLSLVFVFSITLYILHIWAAGDSKLLIILGILIPGNYCMLFGRIIPWSIIVVSLSFSISFLYLFVESIWMFINHKGSFSIQNVKNKIQQFIQSYIINMIYISLAIKIETLFFREWIDHYEWAILAINLSFILLISSLKITQNKVFVIGVLLFSIILSPITNVWFFSHNRLQYFIIISIIMIIKIIISEYNYTTIPTSEVKKGMIISSFSSIVMSNSKIKGLPQISHEDMRSRLTQEEADAIIQWGKTKGSLKTIQIVRKMPFAIFIFLGLLIYSTIWGISN